MKNLTTIILKIYSNFATIIDNIFYKKKEVKKNNFLSNGFFKNGLNNKIIHSHINNTKKLQINKYMNKFIINSDELKSIIKNIFIENKLADLISSLTGFNYSIDYLIFYETLHISADDQNKGWFANHWHFDKPFSRNTLKVIIPASKISDDQGPMEILSIENSKKKKNNLIADFKLEGDVRDFFLFLPNVCKHKAGNPNIGKSRQQFMFQLNPAAHWFVSNELDKLQNYIEPKFPLFYRRKKTRLNEY